MDELARGAGRDSPPIRREGLVIRSGKDNGFIAGADIDEFGELKSVDDAIALVKPRLGYFRAARGDALSDAGAGARLLPGRRDWSWRSPAVIASSSTSRRRASACPR